MVSQVIIKNGSMSGAETVPPFIHGLNRYGGAGIKPSTRYTRGLVIGQTGRRLENGSFDYHLIAIDLDDPKFNCGAVETSFLGHGLAFNPVKPERAVLFEKRGKGACEVDLRAGKVVREILTADNRQFYGHGAYSPDGKILYAAETITEGEFNGLIVMRDAKSFKEIGEFPSYGPRPHDCQILKDSKTMIITNGGGLINEKEKGSVTYVDIESQKLIKKISIDNRLFNAGHVAVAENGDIAVVSAPREGSPAKRNGGVTIGGKDKELKTADGPSNILKKLVGETLSVCIDDHHRIAAATTPDANRITFWDLDSGKMKHTIKVTHPRGVAMTQDKKSYIFSYDKPAKIGLVSADTLQPIAGCDIDVAISGSHIASYHF